MENQQDTNRATLSHGILEFVHCFCFDIVRYIYILAVLLFLREGLKGIPECGAAGVMVVLPRGRLSHYSESASATTLSLHIHIQFASRPYLFDISERLLPQLPACSS